MERLGLGPETCLARNPRLVYGRMTGWGQEGPLAGAAGHDLNYIALTGAPRAIGRAGQKPTPPLNLVGDYGGGALYLAFGLVCALLEAQKSGLGQVVDAAMIDGVASLMTPFFGLHAAGLHSDRRGENILDSGAPYYDVYACADGRYVSVAPIEAKFRAEFYRLIGINAAALPSADDRANWSAVKDAIATRIATRPAAEWCAILEGTDACVAPVLSMSEAPNHPHHRARRTFVEIDGIVQPAPAPRFSRTAPDTPASPRPAGPDADEALAAWGVASERIALLREAGITGYAKRPG
jgi:alpha-methylacyl-CoA racemase